MKERRPALIEWYPADKGGRRTPFIGARYLPIIVVPIDKPVEGFSVVITHIQKPIESPHATCEVGFLIDDAPWEMIQPGNTFEVFEGRRAVARITVQ